MAANRFLTIFGRTFAVLMAVTGLMASEHRGVVKSAGTPIPGVTVTATMGEKKVTTTTDDNGAYAFPNLEDGVWALHVEMLGFGAINREIGVGPDAPSPEWDLKLLSASEIKSAMEAAANPKPATTAAATPAAPTTPTTTAAAPADTKPAETAKPTTPAESDTTKPATTTANNNGRGGRGQQNGGGRGQGNGNNGRPSLTQAVNGFQRANINATGDNGGGGGMDAPDMSNMGGDFGASAGDALVMNGTVSSGIAMPGGGNDWFGGRGMDGGFGGPGMMGMGGPGGDGMGGAPGMDNGGGRGGRGGGGPGGGGPGMGGGPGGRGGGGGGGFGNLNVGGGGGRGGRGGGPGGRGGRGGNPNSFGNGRRGGRSTYNASVSFTADSSILDAQNLSQVNSNISKPSYGKYSATSTLGGPLKIPHLIKTDKINFNLSYSLRRSRNASTTPYTLPTAAELNGDFSQVLSPTTGLPVVIYDANGAPFPNAKIPGQFISQQALGLLKFFPTAYPSFTGRYNYQSALTSTSDQDNINTRLSGSINAKNQLNGSFSWQRGDGSSPSFLVDPSTGANWFSGSHQTATNSSVQWTYHFTQRTFNRLSYNFSRNVSTSTPYWANRTNLSAQLGITGNLQDPNFWGPPGISFSGGSAIASISDGTTQINRAQTGRLGDSLIWIKGRHTVTFGADYNRLHTDPISQSNARGSFAFTGVRTQASASTGCASTTAGCGGYDFADFLLGLPNTSQIAYGNADKYFRNSWYDGYVTDNFQLNPRLTLSLGLRWDYQAPVYELHGRLVNMAVGANYATATPVCGTTIGLLPGTSCTSADQVGLSTALVKGDPTEFQPRVGFAWRPFKKASTVVRGGYGRYYNTSVYQTFASQMSQQYPLSQTLMDGYSSSLPITLANGFIRPTTTPSLPSYALDPNFRIGFVDYWQMSVQQNLKGSLAATITYNGNKGTHQVGQIIPYSSPSQGTTYTCGGQACPSNYWYISSGANSNLEQVSGQLQRRFRAGFQGNVTYTLTHLIDEGNAGGRGGVSNAAQNWLDFDAERANSSLARRHAVGLTMGYNTGQGLSGGALLHGWKGALIKGWNLNTNLSVSSGAFETPSITSRALGNTAIIGPLRAQYTGQPVFVNGALNPAAFTTPIAGTYGDAGRNIITGPATFSMGASMGRTFRFADRKSADLRFDATNILNHVNATSYNTTVGTSQFGVVQYPTAGMRAFTVTLRFRF
jgi:hypothetical protein